MHGHLFSDFSLRRYTHRIYYNEYNHDIQEFADTVFISLIHYFDMQF